MLSSSKFSKSFRETTSHGDKVTKVESFSTVGWTKDLTWKIFSIQLDHFLLALPVRERFQTTYSGMVKPLPIMLGMASGEPVTERLQTTQHGMVKLLGDAFPHNV
jgi:hypothetical protein